MTNALDDIDQELEEAGQASAEEHAKMLVEKGYRKGFMHATNAWYRATSRLIEDEEALEQYLKSVKRWAHDPWISSDCSCYPAPIIPDLD